jgi:hypothetical protein
VLTVHGKDVTTGQEIDARFTTSAILTTEETKEKKSRDMTVAVS